MLLTNTIPQIPTDTSEILIYVIAGLGIILLTYGIFLETEKRQDLVFLIGSACLLIYAIYIDNLIFMIAMSGIFLASLVEFAEILFGVHKGNKYELKKLIRKK